MHGTEQISLRQMTTVSQNSPQDYRKALVLRAIYFANQWQNSISRKLFEEVGVGTGGIALTIS